MSKILNYVKESYDELLHKVSWPTYKELQNSAVVVAVASLIIAAVVSIMDYVGGAHPQFLGIPWKGILGLFYTMFGG